MGKIIIFSWTQNTRLIIPVYSLIPSFTLNRIRFLSCLDLPPHSPCGLAVTNTAAWLFHTKSVLYSISPPPHTLCGSTIHPIIWRIFKPCSSKISHFQSNVAFHFLMNSIILSISDYFLKFNLTSISLYYQVYYGCNVNKLTTFNWGEQSCWFMGLIARRYSEPAIQSKKKEFFIRYIAIET